ncbi:DUF4054 domain-containing protein [Lichenifustis flavocetrariae]|uniref:DUF4054 domain-containing protein n=1 Tax=Lichenifustis flavocetrariae TaxID=2949735 RepID=A0AA42CLZ6_9HYPH|nr:DUF4054 domain-containing protein [Lichenifustis flavocetrariae]MCW6510981.1 DUF4054 domain-containing protein [Lichenifustis flavocetrariae]
MSQPSPTDLTTRFPAFAAIDPNVLAAVLAEAATRVDTTWTPGDYPLGIMLYAAHVLTLDGFGTGAEAALGAAGASGFQTLRSGALHLERAPTSEKAGSSALAQTSYGRRFLALLAVNQPAILVP